MNKRILFLDDIQERHDKFRGMSIGYVVDYVWTATEAIEKLANKELEYDAVCLDHDLGGEYYVDSEDPRGTGYTVAKWVEENCESAEINRRIKQFLIHSHNDAGARRMHQALAQTDVPTRRIPFGFFTLSAAI